MHTTSATLLERLKQPGEQEAWRRFVHLYVPLLFFWLRRLGVPDQDAADLVQEVLAALVNKLPEFQYDRSLGFRNWLRTVALNKWRDHCRRGGRVPVTVPLDDDVSAKADVDFLSEAEYRRFLVARAFQLMQTEFSPKTWKACWAFVVEGRPAEEIARELDICVGAVYVAKSRVLSHLRRELQPYWE